MLSLRITTVSMVVQIQNPSCTWRAFAVHRLISAVFCTLEEVLGGSPCIGGRGGVGMGGCDCVLLGGGIYRLFRHIYTFQTEVDSSELVAQVLKSHPPYPVPPRQRLLKDFSGWRRYRKAAEKERCRWSWACSLDITPSVSSTKYSSSCVDGCQAGSPKKTVQNTAQVLIYLDTVSELVMEANFFWQGRRWCRLRT